MFSELIGKYFFESKLNNIEEKSMFSLTKMLSHFIRKTFFVITFHIIFLKDVLICVIEDLDIY